MYVCVYKYIRVCIYIYIHTYINTHAYIFLMVYASVREKFSHFDNIVQKASAPISTTNGKTSQFNH